MRSDVLTRATVVLVPVAVFLIPFTTRVIALRLPALATATQALLVLIAVLAVVRFQPSSNPAQIAALLLPSLMLISLATAPNELGGELTLSAVYGAGLVIAVARWDQRRLAERIALPLLLASSLQSLFVIAQTFTGEATGLTWLWPDAELRTIDGLLRVQGLMTHVYEPAALALLAAGVAIAVPAFSPRLRWLWLIGSALAGSTVGLTHSRAALFGVLAIAVVVAVAMRRSERSVRNIGGALLIGFLIGAALTASAWAHRAEHSTTGGIDEASLGRITLARQAIRMAVDHPLVGVGPGRYMPTMYESYEVDDKYPFRAHSVSLTLAAENGIIAGAAISLLVGWAIVRAVRSGLRGAAHAVSISGFLLFDVLHYDRRVGLLMFALWLAVLQHQQRQPDSPLPATRESTSSARSVAVHAVPRPKSTQ